jgi:tetratricopeptide (TPR) repeat protein
VARRGAGAATGRRVLGAASGASRAWRDADEAARSPRPDRLPASVKRAAAESVTVSPEQLDAERRAARESRATEEWVLVEEVRDEAEGAVSRAARGRRPSAEPEPLDLAEEVRAQLVRAVGSARTERVERRLGEAVEHFDAERFGDAARILKKLSDEAPTVPAVRELYGLTLYRQEKWKQAARELEAFRLLSGSTEQHPVLADCYRALRQWPQVEELWYELRQDSPDAELVTEGRIVMAGSLADRDRVTDALRLLQQGWSFPKRPRMHHLRRAYALADLYERAGEVPKARDLFLRIRNADPSFADVGQRLHNLR